MELEAQTAANWYGTEDYGFDELDTFGGLDAGDFEGLDSRDPKRRRIARACDMCRKKKIKCDGKLPKCSHCENYKSECVFTQVEKKRAPPKGAKYIEGLENRLGRMESLLRLSGLLTEDDDGRTDLGTLEKRFLDRQQSMQAQTSNNGSNVHSPSTPSKAHAGTLEEPSTATPDQDHVTPLPEQESIAVSSASNGTKLSGAAVSESTKSSDEQTEEVDALADQMCSLITNNCGETRYYGSSSGFSIFSPKGIQWVNEKTGDDSFQQMIAATNSDEKHGFDHWKPEVFNDLFDRRIFKPLPGREECFALLHDYFEHFNQMFPLFHEPTFMHLVDRQYSMQPYEGSGWWASFNVALAISHRLRVMSNVVGQEEDDHAWGYLKNAMAVMSELTMRNTDLLSVQALLGMALFLQGTPNPQPSFFLVSAAIRLSHSIGLHKRGSGFNLNEVENEQRKRVFWIAYVLDKDICLRSGRPPVQDDDDMNVELPSEEPPDNIGSIPLASEGENGKRSMNLFRLMCTFSQIQSRVYKRLYSVKASRQSDGELLNTIGELDAELEEWKDSIPLDYRPEHEIKGAHTPLILHVVVLHFAYYNCLTTIHRMSVHHGYWTSRLSDYAIQGLNARPLNPRVFMSAALCVNAARTSIGLIRYIPQGDYACVWMILYYPVSSLVTLFANILQNPQDARARADFRLMSSVVGFLTTLERDVSESISYVRRMLSVCAEFERIARIVLSKAERELRGRAKRKAAGGVPMTEREKEKALRERGAAGIIVEKNLEEGKTWEQIQIETQASYRRPKDTPGLRASVARSQGSGSPGANWVENQVSHDVNGFRSPTLNDSTAFAQQPVAQGQQHSVLATPNGQWVPARPSVPDALRFPVSPTAANLSAHSPSAMYTRPAAETLGAQTSPEIGNGPLYPEIPNVNSIDYNPFSDPVSFGGGPRGSFQQPFVPQDLWQMPMTLEWDWAEGLNLGSFAQGPQGPQHIYDSNFDENMR